ncbi:RHS repeat-associated core domain-containing protein [Actinokineospora guangxiensis]|uniref:RHS repeat-associated core domain-containing protein n=1 Tax=Actinokineospora guangxiensis TaxID=1490288 RepID=A0ABW0EFM5_9PSEU
MRYTLLKSAAVVAVMAVAATTVTAVAAPVPAEARDAGPGVSKERSVPGKALAVKVPPRAELPNHVPSTVAWPAAGKAELVSGGAQATSGAPVRISRAAAKVTVETFGREVARKARVDGVVMKVSGAAGGSVTVDLDYKGFAGAYGGDYGSRLTFTQYPACLLSTPEKPECRQGTPLKSANNARDKRLTAAVPLTAGPTRQRSTGTVVVASAGGSGSGGDYSATDLAPSGSWSAGTSSGDFTYSIPMTMPTAPAGPAPQLALAYSSGSLDGRTSATNNQASWVGDGWDLSAGGFIERGYTACSDDPGNQGGTQVGDLCWKDLPDEELTVSLGGLSGKFVKDTATGKFRPEKDDGSRIEKLTGAVNGDDNGEHWKVTTIDGTQYFLGLNQLPGWTSGKPVTKSVFTMPVFGNNAGEPCHQSAYANSVCTQAYRWNVDLVVDRHGNAMAFYYDTEINHYKRAGQQGTDTPYVAAGRINRIEYGLRSNALHAPAPARVVFDVAERCLPSGAITCAPAQLTEANAAHWPDVPFDRICAAGEDCAQRYSPAFFTRKRLTKVRTQTHDGTEHVDVDSWALRQQFPGAAGTEPSLWLAGVTRTGHTGGTAALPEITFGGLAMANRVDATEGLLPLTRYRIVRVTGDAGAVTEVVYADRDCVRGTRMPANPHTNTMRCYPVYWTPPGAQEPVLDWFHKYVVKEISEDSVTGGPQEIITNYEYPGGGAWHYDENDDADAAERTWSLWRGYGLVRTIQGAVGSTRTISEVRYLRGMDEDVLPNGGKRDVHVTDGDGGTIEDDDRLAGFERETLLHSGGQVVSATVNTPQLIETANDGAESAYMVRTQQTETRSRQENGQWRRTSTATTFNSLGLATREDVAGDVAVTGDETCSETTYLSDSATWMLSYASRVRTIAKPCSAWPGTEDDVVTDVRSSYDGQAHGTAPTRGVVTTSERWTGGSTYQVVSTTEVDAYGRVTKSTDADGGETLSSYEPATGVPHTYRVTSPNGWVTTTVRDTARGLVLAEIGINGERSDLAYDPLGRLTAVWKPGRSKADGKSANALYAYQYRTDGPTVVTSQSLRENETYAVSYDLYDGFLRPRQSQTPSAIGGRLVSDTFYDSRGNVVRTHNAMYNLDAPAPQLFTVANDGLIPNKTVTDYDDLSRPLELVQYTSGVEVSRTKTRYSGDNTYTTPPSGGVAVGVIKNANGAIVERREYHQHSANGVYGPSATYDSTRFAYSPRGQTSKVTDAQGNEWTYEYDKLSRKIADTDPDRGRTTYAYDALDQLVSTTDARGKTLAYEYDSIGRKIGQYEGSLTGTKLASWTYDTLRKGALTSSTRHIGQDAYTTRVDNYDNLGRPTKTSVVIPSAEGLLADTYSFEASFSAVNGQLLSEKMPAAGGLAAENVIHTYDANGLPNSTYGLNTYASDHQYSPFGETLLLAMGVSPRRAWLKNTFEEGTRRLTNVLITRNTSATTTAQAVNRSLSYDPAGNITRISDVPVGGPADTQCFEYDHLQRMKSSWTPSSGNCAAAKSVAALGGSARYWHDYTFDTIGNRTTKTSHATAGTTTETYEVPTSGPASVRPHAVNAVVRVGPNGTARDEFTYDAAGNTVTRKIGGDTQTLEWNAEGRLTKAVEADGDESTYVYDANGNRLIKREPTGKILYLPGHEVIALAGATTTTGKRYYKHAGETVALRTSVAGLTYMFGDHNGTDTTNIAPGSGAGSMFVSRRNSDPFGVPRGTQPSFWPDDKGLVDGVKDTTGLTSIGAREYDPVTGRFISVDPLIDMADSQRMNAYAYANNSPVTFTDPTGLNFSCMEGILRCGKDGGRERAAEKEKKRQKKQVVQQQSRKQAASEAGISEPEMRQLEEDAASDKGFWGVMKEELPEIIGDLTGLSDIRDCFTNFDIWACAGLIPVGRLFKLAANIGKVIGAVHKALKWEERVSKARARLSGVYRRTEDLVRQGMAKLDDVADTAGATCKRHSFPPGTRILLADGSTKPIETVVVGDRVLATDPHGRTTSSQSVTATWLHSDEPDRTTLMVKSSASAKPEVVSATDWHPFWVDNKKSWAAISDVAAGDDLVSHSGQRLRVVEAWKSRVVGVVHDLTIDRVHSYYVMAGRSSVLVHNCGTPTDDDAVPGIVWRSLARGEDPAVGLRARDVSADSVSPLSHVAGAKRTPWVSTSKLPSVAFDKYNGGHGVVAIDLSRVVGTVEDVSSGFPGKGRIDAYAKRDQEVLIFGEVPADAIVGYWP